MTQKVILNGIWNDLGEEPSLVLNTRPSLADLALNGGMVRGIEMNGYCYPPAESGCVLHMPGLPGYGASIWDRSPKANHGVIFGAVWERLPSGLWHLHLDGSDDTVIMPTTGLPTGAAARALECWFYSYDTGNLNVALSYGNESVNAHFSICVTKQIANDIAIDVWGPGWYNAAGIQVLKWYHAYADFDGSTPHLVLNGVSKTLTASGSPAPNTGSAGMRLGQAAAGSFKSQIRVAFPRAYSAVQPLALIKRHYIFERQLMGV